jgi:ankyrin repeat protein
MVEKVKAKDAVEFARVLDDYDRIRADSALDEGIESVGGTKGWTVLHYAACLGQHKIIELLVKRQVNANKPTEDWWTPLQLACASGCIESVAALLKHPRIQVNRLTLRGTALH